jgi:hypothetical protein
LNSVAAAWNSVAAATEFSCNSIADAWNSIAAAWNSLAAAWNSVAAAWLQCFQLSKHGPECMHVCLYVCMNACVLMYACLRTHARMLVCNSFVHIYACTGHHSVLKHSQTYIRLHRYKCPYLAVVICDHDNGPLEGLLMHVERWRDVCNEALSTEQSVIGMLLRGRHAWSLNVCVCMLVC